MKRRTFIKQLGLVSSLPWLAGTAGAATASAPANSATSLKILSCNIRVDVPEDAQTGNAWADRKDLCAQVISGQRADIVCLQEVQSAHFHDLKARLTGFDAFGLANPDTLFHPANAIFFSRSRFELISAGGFWLSDTPHVAGSKSWDSARSRFANWVQLRDRTAGKEFRVWNTHLDHIGQQARERGAALIVEAAKALPPEYPQLLTGDLNANSRNRAVEMLKEGGWVDTYAAVHGNEDPGFTFHGFKGPQAETKTAKGGPRSKIDFIFYRGPFKPVSAAIIRDGRNGRYPSDHFFVSASVIL